MIKMDFGEWNIPTKWEQVSLKQYQQLQFIYEGEKVDIRDVIAILTKKEKKEIDELPTEFFQSIMEAISFVYEKPETGEPTSKIEISGETYQINFTEKLKTGEFVDSQMAIEADKHNYALLFAILCRKAGEIYDDDFIANILPDREKMFEEQPITNILPLVGYFFQLWKIYAIPTFLSSTIEAGVNQLAKDIKSSQKLGVGKKLYLKWQMKKLRKSLQSIKST